MGDERKMATNAQKRRAVEAVLSRLDGESLSNRQAAARAGVSHHFVQIVSREWAMAP
ncbi:Transposase [Methylorubrum extorquens]